ncbi:trimeric intracellular cation channel family protein [Brachybacterium paraconglomeratum]|uniref:trimeric intracellular cation channel family protein n=1 Tax=Brachybacterium paraconglomeratum TaxID=173362 RepID=UPI0021A93675|nr:trimeric intracellular cation channel family protein [Brachybacterium paraconglomeratum]MCT1909329.1 trimeric intracellular cation channel family protein [Brachybacterium paraconglomeratum]
MDPLELLVTNDFLRVLDLVGVFVMGVAAGAIASRLNFDAVGFAVIGIVAGLGGGLVRDLILDYGTPAAFDGPWYLTCALGGAMFTFVIHADGPWWRRLVTALDIAAMGLWAATGTAKSLGYGLDTLPAILLGVTSAVGGGVIRDVLVGRIPQVFGGGPLYATGALVTAVLTWLVLALGLPSPTVLVAVAVGALLAGVAAWRRWSLPAHQEWQVTMSATQLKQLVRRTRKDERERVAQETGAIPVVDVDHDDLAEDAAAEDLDASDYEDRIFPDPAELPGTAENERREEQDPGTASPR